MQGDVECQGPSTQVLGPWIQHVQIIVLLVPKSPVLGYFDPLGQALPSTRFQEIPQGSDKDSGGHPRQICWLLASVFGTCSGFRLLWFAVDGGNLSPPSALDHSSSEKLE